MSRQTAHAFEDKLLELAYGELGPEDAHAVEEHVKGCPRCAEALAGMRGVSAAFQAIPPEPAPSGGLDSLLAFAEQQARRNAAGPAPKRRWHLWLVGLTAASAVLVVGVVSLNSWKVSPQALIGEPAEALGQAPSPQMKSIQEFGDGTYGAAPEAETSAETGPAPVPTPASPGALAYDARYEREPGNDGVREREDNTLKLSKRAIADEPFEGSGGGFGSRVPSKALAKKKAEAPPAPKSGRMRIAGKQDAPRKDAMAGKGAADAMEKTAPEAAPEEAPTPQAIAELDDDAFSDKSARVPDQVVREARKLAEERRLEEERKLAQAAPSRAPSSASPNQSNAATEPSALAYHAPSMAGAPAAAPTAAPPPPPSVAQDEEESSADGELARLRSALSRARGDEAARLLARICELELQQGEVRAGRKTCAQVISEHPKTNEAEWARRTLRALDAPARAKPAASEAVPAAPVK